EHVDRLGDVVGAGEVTGAAHRVRGQREEHVDVRGQDRARDLHGVAVAAGTGHVSEVRGVPDPLLPRGDDLGEVLLERLHTRVDRDRWRCPTAGHAGPIRSGFVADPDGELNVPAGDVVEARADLVAVRVAERAVRLRRHHDPFTAGPGSGGAGRAMVPPRAVPHALVAACAVVLDIGAVRHGPPYVILCGLIGPGCGAREPGNGYLGAVSWIVAVLMRCRQVPTVVISMTAEPGTSAARASSMNSVISSSVIPVFLSSAS